MTPYALSLVDKADLHRLKQQVHVSLHTANAAICEIIDRKLYLIECPTWQEFFEKNWGMKRATVNERIRINNLYTSEKLLVDTGEKEEIDAPMLKASTVAKARALIKLGNVKRCADLAPAYSSNSENNKKNECALELDRTGCPVPKEAIAMWLRREEPQAIVLELQRIKHQLEEIAATPDMLYAGCAVQQSAAELSAVISSIKAFVPFAVCPFCQGKKADTCRACSGRGLVSKYFWDRAVPEELRKLREKAKP